MTNVIQSIPLIANLPPELQKAIFFLLLIWSLVWKGFALWRAARNESRNWFIVLLVVNTVGVLEILYLFVFSKKQKILPENQGGM